MEKDKQLRVPIRQIEASVRADAVQADGLNFCSLPGDIRNAIYELVCHHRGPVVTASWPYVPTPYDTRAHFSTPALGQVKNVGEIERCMKIPVLRLWTRNGGRIDTYDFTRRWKEWLASGGSLTDLVVIPERGNEYEFLHFCSPQCLLPPSLTRVNRQLRKETMSYFYGVNKFRFAFGVNENAASSTFLKWLRGLREETLQFIDYLELVRFHLGSGAGGQDDLHDAIRITKDRNTQRWSVRLLYADEEMRKRDQDGVTTVKPRRAYRILRQKHIVERCARRIEEHGPSARRIEMMLCRQKWYRKHPMRDQKLVKKYDHVMCTFLADEKMGRAGKIHLMEQRNRKSEVTEVSVTEY